MELINVLLHNSQGTGFRGFFITSISEDFFIIFNSVNGKLSTFVILIKILSVILNKNNHLKV